MRFRHYVPRLLVTILVYLNGPNCCQREEGCKECQCSQSRVVPIQNSEFRYVIEFSYVMRLLLSYASKQSDFGTKYRDIFRRDLSVIQKSLIHLTSRWYFRFLSVNISQCFQINFWREMWPVIRSVMDPSNYCIVRRGAKKSPCQTSKRQTYARMLWWRKKFQNIRTPESRFFEPPSETKIGSVNQG